MDAEAGGMPSVLSSLALPYMALIRQEGMSQGTGAADCGHVLDLLQAPAAPKEFDSFDICKFVTNTNE